MVGSSITRGRDKSKIVQFLLVLCLVLPNLLPLAPHAVHAKAADWGEDIGDIYLDHSWGHGTSVNLTLDNVSLQGSEFILDTTNNNTNITDQDLDDGSKDDITLTGDNRLVLSVVAPSWSTRSAWNIPWVDADAWLAAPTLGDLDDDGDLDAYVGLEDTVDGAVISAYNNTGDDTFPTWTIEDPWNFTLSANSNFAVPTLGDLDDDGDLDMLVGDNDGSSYGYNNTGNETNPGWTAESSWDAPDVGQGAGPALVDIDDDGDLDVFIGRGPGQTRAYENTGGASSPTWTRNGGWDPPGMAGIANPGFGDLDGDGDYDLILGDSAGLMHTYENTGTVNSPTWTDKDAWDIAWDVGDYAAPTMGDIDNDGDLDAFVGENIATSYAFENTGSKANEGYFNSTAIGVGKIVNWTSISWTETRPGQTDATLYVRTGNTTPPDGTWSGWTSAMSTPAGTAFTCPPGSYIQVQVYLETTNTARTSEVSDIQLDFKHYVTTGSIQTNDLPPEDLVKWGTVSMDNDTKGETIEFHYSVDSGTNWVQVPADGNLSAVDITNSKIRFRVNLTTSVPVVTPEFLGIDLTFMKLLDSHHLHLDPVQLDIVVGESFNFTVELHDINNNTLNKTLTWTTDIGAIDEYGNLTAQTTPGEGVVNVSYGPLSLQAQVTVLLGPLDRVNVTPTSIDIEVGNSTQLSVQGYDMYDNQIPDLEYNWSTDVGALDPTSGNTTTFTARTTPGTGYIDAAVGIINATIPVTIHRGPLENINITPTSIDADEKETFTVSAKGYDQYWNLIPDLSFNWSTGVGTCDPAIGVTTNFTAQEVDDNLTNQTVIGNINVTIGDISSTIDVTVLGEFVQWLTNLTIEPKSVTLYPIENVTFKVTGYDQFGNLMNITATWTTDVGTMTPAEGVSSMFRPNVDEGTGVVTATVGAISVSADVTVLANETYPFPKILKRSNPRTARPGPST